MVLDGVPTDTTDYEDSEAAAIAPLGCSSSAAAFVPSGSSYMVSGMGRGEAAERKWVQFFVNDGKGFTTVVRSSPDAVVSDVLRLDADEYAVCGSRLVKVGCALSENLIGNAATAPWWCT